MACLMRVISCVFSQSNGIGRAEREKLYNANRYALVARAENSKERAKENREYARDIVSSLTPARGRSVFYSRLLFPSRKVIVLLRIRNPAYCAMKKSAFR